MKHSLFLKALSLLPLLLLCLLMPAPAQSAVGTVPIEVLSVPASGDSNTPSAAPRQHAWKGRDGIGIRSRKVALSPSFRMRQRLEKGEILSLALFDDAQLDATIESFATNANGTTVTSARIDGSEWGRVFLATTGETVTAKIHLPERKKFYAIQRNRADNSYYAVELDPEQAQYDGIGIEPPGLADPAALDQEQLPAMAEDESVDAATVVDVMVVYTSGAVTDAGSIEEVNNLIALGMAFGNDAHTNSNTGIYLNLVHSQQLAYADSDDRGTDLQRLTYPNDGYMDEVHDLRDAYGADFVVLMTGDYASDGGIAWVLTSVYGGPSYAFSVVTQPAFDSYTPAHEIGHNMGLSHADDQNYQAGPTNWQSDPYGFGASSAGWHWHPTANQHGYCSVMTYTSGSYFGDGLSHTRVGLFSDPSLYDHGAPSGHNTRGYNAQVLRTLKTVYAGYRSRPQSNNSITVDYPVAGAILTGGQTYNILWDSAGVGGNVKISLYNNGSFARTVSASTLNDRIFAWTVPPDLSGGNYSIRISDIAETASGISGTFSLNTAFYNEPLAGNPGYATSGSWEFGPPVANDNATFGGPAEAYSGAYIYDTNLDGVSGATSLLTTTAIDCSGYANIQLRFLGWFSVYTGYTARVEISNDGMSWTTLYERAGPHYESLWTERIYDISAYADDEQTVYVRWTHENIGGGANYSGMSVDDIELRGISTVNEIEIQGNGVAIADGASSPSASNHTDFGEINVAAETVVRTFTVKNLGGAALNLTGSPRITLSGPHAADFIVTSQPASPITGGGSTFFQVTFDPSAPGMRTAAISIANDDSDENPYTFAIQGTGILAPEMEVKGNSATIPDGSSTPSPLNHTEFGAVTAVAGAITRTFTIANSGNADLELSGTPMVAITGPHSGDFSLVLSPSTPVAPSGSTPFQIRFDPDGVGPRSATVSIANTDDDENPYTFAIQGTGLPSPEIEVSGNSVAISSGDGSPSPADHTDFGNTDVLFGSSTRSFTIANSGTGSLLIDSITLTGVHAAEFSLSMPPASSVAPQGSTTFSISFDPVGTGVRSAIVSIANDDSDENPFTFSIQGTGGDYAEISLRGNGREIESGDTTPVSDDHTDFGSIPVSNGTVNRTFTIENEGSGTLSLTGSPLVAITPGDLGFAVASLPASTIGPAGGSTTFQVSFSPSSPGRHEVRISIANGDGDENPYTFTVQGAGTAPATVSTLDVADISENSAVLRGHISQLGYPLPSAHGFVLNSDGDPDLGDTVINLGAATSTGTYATALPGLAEATTYYLKAFATNGTGTAYGNEVAFTTGEKDSQTCFPVNSKTGRLVIICF